MSTHHLDGWVEKSQLLDANARALRPRPDWLALNPLPSTPSTIPPLSADNKLSTSCSRAILPYEALIPPRFIHRRSSASHVDTSSRKSISMHSFINGNAEENTHEIGFVLFFLFPIINNNNNPWNCPAPPCNTSQFFTPCAAWFHVLEGNKNKEVRKWSQRSQSRPSLDGCHLLGAAISALCDITSTQIQEEMGSRQRM